MPKIIEQFVFKKNVNNQLLFPSVSFYNNSNRIGIGIAVLYTVCMLYVGLKYHVIGDYNVETDFYWSYAPNAQQILEGKFPIEEFRGPMYPLLLAGIKIFSFDLFKGGVVLSALSAGLVLFLVYITFSKIFPIDSTLVITLLVATNRVFNQYSYTVGTDMVFNALSMGVLFFFLRQDHKSLSSFVFAGVFATLAYLTRYNGIAFVIAVPSILMVVNPNTLTKREKIKGLIIFTATFLILVLPWGLYCYNEKGSFFYNKNYLNIAYEMFEKSTTTWDTFWFKNAQKYKSLLDVILTDPVLFLKKVGLNAVNHFIQDMEMLIGWHIAPFVLIGAVITIRNKVTKKMVALWSVGIFFYLVLLLVFYSERFSLFLLPIYLSVALMAVTSPYITRMRVTKNIHVGSLVVIFALCVTCIQSVEFNRENIGSGPKEVLAISNWFQRTVDKQQKSNVIVARKPHIAYYLNMDFIVFPNVNSIEELEQSLKSLKADYLYFGVLEASLRPQLQYLVYPKNAPPWLEPVTYVINPPTVLYRVRFDKGAEYGH